MGKLSVLLRAVDEAAVSLAKKSLAPPAKANDLDALGRDACGGKLPPELHEWFSWHDGQRGDTELDANNYTAMSAKSSRAIFRLLNDPKQECLRPRPSWIPLFENGGGDYLMYETTGPKRGALMVWLHDDDGPRKPMYASLADWATSVVKHQQKLAKTAKGKAPFELSNLQWTAIGRAPALDKVPIGTILRAQNGRSSTNLFLKTADDAWFWNSSKTYEHALEELESELKKRCSSFLTSIDEVRYLLAQLDPAERKTLARSFAAPR